MMGDALPARDPEQLHQVQPAWVERTSPVNNQGKATYRCLVPGCGKLWSRAVVPGVANNHVKEVHRGMKLRWTHLQSPLTSAQQLHNYMESTRQAKTKSKKKQEIYRTLAGSGSHLQRHALPEMKAPFDYLGRPPPAMTATMQLSGLACLPLMPESAAPPLPWDHHPIRRPACPFPTPWAVAPPLAPLYPLVPPSPMEVDGHGRHLSQDSALITGGASRNGTHRDARIMAVARAETVPLKESLIADPDTASLLGSIICDSYNATITGRFVRQARDVVIGASVSSEGIMRGVGSVLTFQTAIRPDGHAGHDRIIMCGNRVDNVPVALTVPTFWVMHNLPDMWTRLRCPGPLITDRYEGCLPPMRVDMRPLESGATGMSMCLAVTVSIMACLTGCAVRSGWGMTASMDLSGGLHGVDSISAKVQAMHQVGVKHVILAPLGYDPLLLSGRLPRAVQLHFCTTVTEALLLCLEPHPENGAEGGAVPVLDTSRHQAGYLGVAHMLRSYREREDEAPNVDNVAGEVQVVECFVLCAPGAATTEVLGHEESHLDNLALGAVDHVLRLLHRHQLGPLAIPAWPLPDGHHLRVSFSFPPADEGAEGSGSCYGAMTIALVGALTGRALRPGTVVLCSYDRDGLLIPVARAGEADVRILELAPEVHRVVTGKGAAVKLTSMIRKTGSPALRARPIELIGVERIEEAIGATLQPRVNGDGGII